ARAFGRAEKALPVYEDLCRVEIPSTATGKERQDLELEQAHRNAAFWCLLARGRQDQGKLVDAFEAYLKYGSLGAGSTELMPVVYEPAVKAPPEVWAQGPIGAMFAKADDGQGRPLEEKIAQKWNGVKDSTDVESLRRFVALFGVEFKVGREARLRLAELLMKEDGTTSLLDAERHLLLLRRQKADR